MTAIWPGVEWDALDREESVILSGLIVKKQLYCHVYREEAIALLKHTGVSYCLKAIPGLESANLTLAHFNDGDIFFCFCLLFCLHFTWSDKARLSHPASPTYATIYHHFLQHHVSICLKMKIGRSQKSQDVQYLNTFLFQLYRTQTQAFNLFQMWSSFHPNFLSPKSPVHVEYSRPV
jgi:hypothetical protein